MRLRPGAALAVLALVLCCPCEAAIEAKVNATEPQVITTRDQLNAGVSGVNVTDFNLNTIEAKENTTSESTEMANRALQKVVRWVRRVLQGGDLRYPGSDIGLEGSDADYLLNEERTFRGNTYRDLEDNRIRGFTASTNQDFGDTRSASDTADRGLASDTRNREFAPETKNRGFTVNTRNRDFAPEPREKGFTSNTKNSDFVPETNDRGFTRTSDSRITEFTPETRDRGFTPDVGTKASGAEGFRVFQAQPYAYTFRDNEGRDSGINGNGQATTGVATRNFGAPSTRDFDLSEGSTAADGRQSQSTSSAGQRWLRILAEFLQTSAEGRGLLRAQAGQLLEGVDLESGQLPRPLLLLPVPVHAQGSNLRRSEDADDFHRALLALFRQARPRAPLLPPLLLPESPRPVPAAPLPPISSAPPPTRLRFDRSLLIRAELTVYYSDYTEPYTVWYDAESGSSRVDLHGGTTVLYRRVQPGGDVQRVQFRIERFGDDETRRCTWLSTRAVEADRALPALPDPAPFSFTGYQDTVDGRMERWTYSLAGQAGELGAARGEALVFRHELLVARFDNNFAIPYKYRVTVDSSVLGPEVDWYEHRYLEVREQRPDAGHLSIDVERECDVLQRAHRVESVDPLREFVMTHRDSRCDVDFERFKDTHQINYKDPVDEAVRKTLLIRSTRFVESANRQGATAEMENNALGVMLPAEQRLLRGIGPEQDAQADETTEGAEDDAGVLGGPPASFGKLEPLPFPFSTQAVKTMAMTLPDAFSWKRQGGVTHIRNQGYCTSCWAFAVVCAVEGALFSRTRKLVPLSDKQLADCTRSKRDCKETGVVKNAYFQAKNSGIVALTDYQPYMFRNPKLEQCKKREPVVTKISGFVEVPRVVAAVKVSIAKQGPVVVEVDADCGGIKYFRSGVLRDMRCKTNVSNHAVTAIGYSKHKTIGDYFIIKNSWGDAGNGGYVHLHAESNTAGVLTSPSYPVLENKDISNTGRLDSLAKAYADEPSIFKTNGEAEYMAFLKEQKEYLDRNPEIQTLKRRK